MRTGPSALLVAAALASALPACRHGMSAVESTSSQDLSSRASDGDSARQTCRVTFAQCAPPANLAPDLEVKNLEPRTLVHISWRMDLDDRFTERAAEQLRKLAEQGDLETVREIAQAGESAASTLGRCRCQGEKFRPQWEKQRIGEIVKGRLPPAELQSPAYWADRIDPHVAKLRALSRRSAGVLATGDDAGRAELEVQVAKEERELCEKVHAARDVLSADAMTEMRALVYKARAHEAGDASVEVARRALEGAERQPSCAAAERATVAPE